MIKDNFYYLVGVDFYNCGCVCLCVCGGGGVMIFIWLAFSVAGFKLMDLIPENTTSPVKLGVEGFFLCFVFNTSELRFFLEF